MTSVLSGDGDHARERRRTQRALRESLRELSIQLSLLNRQVSANLRFKDVDLACLDLVARHGPLSPGVLAKRSGLHPATLTGVLDRLERGGWVARERDPDDRRAVRLRALPERGREIYRLYAGMNSAMDEICASYDDDELRLLADFLARTTGAGREATDRLAAPDE
ncbi:MAG TPA: MarR family transcriptional regulator [Stackebrandtia sp.]|jgi:DNA-binding MarR family transcriptional regulator|uniref:MarR family transcriptional regulator n=1 Tax=Stackebrandtia sp. TaxID=2023065 RepID=UPI002D3B8644|nr:MarR family transcriptional regulator [Stackebrandtia sp.]HZE38342.1 MarR family transcriptional regulator [Stackebrandtia sp.]